MKTYKKNKKEKYKPRSSISINTRVHHIYDRNATGTVRGFDEEWRNGNILFVNFDTKPNVSVPAHRDELVVID